MRRTDNENENEGKGGVNSCSKTEQRTSMSP